MADRRTRLMTGGGIALAGAVAVGAIAGSVGVFGLGDDPPRVGKLSPIDTTERTTVTSPAAAGDPRDPGPGSTSTPTSGPPPGVTPSTAASPTTTVTAPGVDDHGGDRDDNSGPGSSDSGRDHPDDD